MADIDLTPPPFLDVRNRPPPPPYRPPARQPWRMPPKGLTAVLRAIRRGHDTRQKLRRALRRYDDRDIGKALDSLRASGEITLTGRRYRSTK